MARGINTTPEFASLWAGAAALLGMLAGCAVTAERPASRPTDRPTDGPRDRRADPDESTQQLNSQPPVLSYPLVRPRSSQRARAAVVTHGSGTYRVAAVTITLRPGYSERGRIVFRGKSGSDVPASLRATSRMAAAVAASAVGLHVSDYGIKVRCNDSAVGVAAGAALSATMMAVMAGLPPRRDVAILGTLLPDGVIGPTGSPADQLRAAVRSGRRLIGYPLAQSTLGKVRTATTVDLEQLARSLGAKAVELETVYDAFALLTGRALPLPTPVPAAAMAYDHDMNRAMLTRTAHHRKQSERLYVRAKAIGIGRGSRSVRGRLAQALRHLRTSGDALRKRDPGRALSRAEDGRARLLRAVAHHRLNLRGNSAAGIRRELWALDNSGPKVLGRMRELSHISPATTEQALFLSSAYASLVLGFTHAAQARLRWSQEERRLEARLTAPGNVSGRDTTMRALHWSVDRYASSWRALQSADTHVGLSGIGRSGHAVPTGGLRDASSLLTTVASACLGYVEALVQPWRARLSRLPAKTRRRLVKTIHTVLPMARAGLGLPQKLRPRVWKDRPDHWELARIGGASESLVHSAYLMYRFSYPDRVPERAKVAILRHAERMARMYAARAREQLGYIPLSSRYSYQRARQTGSDDKPYYHALVHYWRAALDSQTALYLHRSSHLFDTTQPRTASSESTVGALGKVDR